MKSPITGSVNEEQLGDLLDQLILSIRASGFSPELIVFVETGAHMPAQILGQKLGLPLLGISAKRGGDGLKKKLMPLIVRMPAWLTRCLRWLEEVSRLHRITKRRVQVPASLDLKGRKVLLFDDASDTGRTVVQVTQALLHSGLERPLLRVAVLAATTEIARRHVDFWALDRNVRFLWSPDMKQC